MDFVNSLTGWKFLNEPLYRWFLFIIALAFMLWAWAAIVSFMK